MKTDMNVKVTKNKVIRPKPSATLPSLQALKDAERNQLMNRQITAESCRYLTGAEVVATLLSML